MQLLAVPYSSTHIAEADLFKERDALVKFIRDFPAAITSIHTTPWRTRKRRRRFKRRSVEALLATLDNWRRSANTFEQDVELEFTDGARIWVHEYARKTRPDRRFRTRFGDAAPQASFHLNVAKDRF